MYLWQIRHNPNHPQTLHSLLLAAFLLVASVATYCGFGNYVVAGADNQPAEADKKPTGAEELLDRVRQELLKHRTIKADLLQTVTMGDQHFKIEGQYLSAAAVSVGDHLISKLKLNYRIVPNQGVQGEILEVCDGKDLWTEVKLPDSKQSVADSRRVTRRNVQQILSAVVAASKQQSIPDAACQVELGLGGMTALLASLERSMTFDAMKEEQLDGHARTIIQGHWKKEVIARLPKEKDDTLPAFIPDLVRIYINNDTLFPEKIYYLKKQPQKKVFKSLVSIEFQNVEFDAAVDDAAFVYSLPADVAPPEDMTKQYIQRLTAAPADAPVKN